MSGGIAQLVAVGAQDAHLVGNPEVSFFRSTYKRHTNFAQTTERQVIQGNVSDNGMSTVRFERKGDMLGYVYLTIHNGTTAQKKNFGNLIDKVELLIGGQVIDEQTNEFPRVSMVLSIQVVRTKITFTHSASSSVRIISRRCHWWPSSIMMWSFVSRGVHQRPLTSGTATQTSSIWMPPSARTWQTSQ